MINTARKAFLSSNASAGVDIVFGMGEVEILQLNDKGFLIDSGLMEAYPEWFSNKVFPEFIGGARVRDANGRWIAAAYSAFGIIYNKEVLNELGFDRVPNHWADLANPSFFGQVAMADPAMSTSTTRAFEMMIQQAIFEKIKQNPRLPEAEAVESGWADALQLIQMIAANARYFTESSTKPLLDVSAGNCAVGLSVDFYGLFQETNLKNRSNSDRFGFVFPHNGTVTTADPIAMLRGAPNRGTALAFMEYVLSDEGQKLWMFRQGAPGGPVQFPLSRPAARKTVYIPENKPYLINTEINPFTQSSELTYNPKWTVPVFKALAFIVKAAFIDPHPELARARKSILKAEAEGRLEAASAATKVLQNLDEYNYSVALKTIMPLLKSGNSLNIIRLQNKINSDMRAQYVLARKIADGEALN